MKTSLLLVLIATWNFAFGATPPTYASVRNGAAYVCTGATRVIDGASNKIAAVGYLMSYSINRNKLVLDMVLANSKPDSSYEACTSADCVQTETLRGDFQWFGSRRAMEGTLRNLTASEREDLSTLTIETRKALESKPTGDALRLFLLDAIQMEELNKNAARVQESVLTDRLNPGNSESYERILLYRNASNVIIGTDYMNDFVLIPSVCF